MLVLPIFLPFTTLLPWCVWWWWRALFFYSSDCDFNFSPILITPNSIVLISVCARVLMWMRPSDALWIINCVMRHAIVKRHHLSRGPRFSFAKDKSHRHISIVASHKWRVSSVLIWWRLRNIIFFLLLCSFSLSLSRLLTSGFQIYPPFLNRVISISAIVVNQLSLRLSGIAFHFISPLWFNEMKINPISFLLKNIFSANELGRAWMRGGGVQCIISGRPRLEAYFSPRRHSMPNLMHFHQSHFDWSEWHTKNSLRPIFVSFGLIYLNYILDALVAVLIVVVISLSLGSFRMNTCAVPGFIKPEKCTRTKPVIVFSEIKQQSKNYRGPGSTQTEPEFLGGGGVWFRQFFRNNVIKSY